MKFSRLSEAFSDLERTTSKKELTGILADLFNESSNEEISDVVYLVRGKIGPDFETLDFGIGEKMMEHAIANGTGKPDREVLRRYKDLGDLGLVAESILGEPGRHAKRTSGNDVSSVFDELRAIANASGPGSQDMKISLMADLVSKLSPLEARYAVRIPLGTLRLGVGDHTIMDALSVVEVGNLSARRAIEQAFNESSDLGLVARIIYNEGIEGLEKIHIEPGRPVKPAMAERMATIDDILYRLGKCAVEGKYDGFRCQVHKMGDEVRIFSRNMEETTDMFPEIVFGVRQQIRADTAIIDAEAITYDIELDEFAPFQITMRRKRKYGIAEATAAYPLRLFVFDMLYYLGKDITMLPNKERFHLLQRAFVDDNVVKIVDRKIIDNKEDFQAWFDLMISKGLEGVIAKDLDAPYALGERKYSWIKLKRSYRGKLEDTIDVVIVGYLKGRGKRARQGLGAILTAVYNENSDTFDTVGKIGSGLTDSGMAMLREALDKIAVEEKPARVNSKTKPDVWVVPQYVVTVMADEITRSPNYAAGARDGEPGYSLRFPRIMGYIRDDRKPDDATTVGELLELYKLQKKSQVM